MRKNMLALAVAALVSFPAAVVLGGSGRSDRPSSGYQRPASSRYRRKMMSPAERVVKNAQKARRAG